VPDPYERHGRGDGRDAWGPVPSRSQARAAAAAEQVIPEVVPEGKRPPGKKDPDLCKAAHWKGPHQPKLYIRDSGWRKRRCYWGNAWGRDVPVWFCAHEEVCIGCGKVLHISIPAEQCPDYHAITEAEQAVLDEEVERWRQRRLARRQPVIDGPQGYRKRKEQT
jgi:hypothetical protein